MDKRKKIIIELTDSLISPEAILRSLVSRYVEEENKWMLDLPQDKFIKFVCSFTQASVAMVLDKLISRGAIQVLRREEERNDDL